MGSYQENIETRWTDPHSRSLCLVPQPVMHLAWKVDRSAVVLKPLALENIKGFILQKLKLLSTMPWRQREWRYSSTILDLGIRWRWAVRFMPLLLYPQGKSLLYPVDRGWVGPRASLHAVENIKILHCRESNPGHPACSLSPTPVHPLIKREIF
jgi:hypothetical protein